MYKGMESLYSHAMYLYIYLPEDRVNVRLVEIINSYSG